MSFSRDQLVRAFPNQPLMVAQFEAFDQLMTELQTTLAQAKAELAAVQAQVDADGRWQPASDLLDSIAALEGQAGAVVLTDGGALAQPIDTADGASLLTKGRADGLYAPHA